MNFVIDLAHYGVSVARWLEHQSVESEGPKVRSLINFSLYYARDKTKKKKTSFSTLIIAFKLK